MAHSDSNVLAIYRAIEKFLDGEILALELVRTVDDAMFDYDGENDPIASVLDDFHLDVALFVADPAERGTKGPYIGPEELRARAHAVKESLDTRLRKPHDDGIAGTLTYGGFVPALAAQIPSLGPIYQEHLSEYEELLPHVFFGGLTRLVMQLCENDTSDDLRQILSALECGMREGDEKVRELIAVSFPGKSRSHGEELSGIEGNAWIIIARGVTAS